MKTTIKIYLISVFLINPIYFQSCVLKSCNSVVPPPPIPNPKIRLDISNPIKKDSNNYNTAIKGIDFFENNASLNKFTSSYLINTKTMKNWILSNRNVKYIKICNGIIYDVSKKINKCFIIKGLDINCDTINTSNVLIFDSTHLCSFKKVSNMLPTLEDCKTITINDANKYIGYYKAEILNKTVDTVKILRINLDSLNTTKYDYLIICNTFENNDRALYSFKGNYNFGLNKSIFYFLDKSHECPPICAVNE